MSWVIVRMRNVQPETKLADDQKTFQVVREFQQYMDYGNIYGHGRFEDPSSPDISILHQPMPFDDYSIAANRLYMFLQEEHKKDPEAKEGWWYAIWEYLR